MLKIRNYYISTFFWSTASKILNAIFGFVSVPILLDQFGKSDYGILSIAMACNAYMYVLDLGMNVGAVKYYSQWKTEGKLDLLERVVRTNITFYLFIALTNILLLLCCMFWGSSLFAIPADKTVLLNSCFIILISFSVLNWVGAVFYQLLVANEMLGFAMKVQCVQVLLKGILVAFVLFSEISLLTYFFYFTLIVSLPVIPYAFICRRKSLIKSLLPAFYFSDLKIVLLYSLSIFALTLLQVTAVQSRPIILGIFSENGDLAVADFRIVELIPAFLIVVCGMFSSIFLPRTSAIVARSDKQELIDFANTWTLRTSILANLLCVPFMLCAADVLFAYVGPDYTHLSIWLVIWCLTVILQIHTTPGNAIVLAYGKTRPLVVVTFLGCVVSIGFNILLVPSWGLGAAVLSYLLYVLIIIGQYYLYYYRNILHLQSMRMFKNFAGPTLLALLVLGVCMILSNYIPGIESYTTRWEAILICGLKVIVWGILYILILRVTGIIKSFTIRDFK